MLARLIAWVAMLAFDAAAGLAAAEQHATPAGWVAYGAASLLWVTFYTWLLLVNPRERR